MSKIKKTSGAVVGAVLLSGGMALALLPGAASATAGRVHGTEYFVISGTGHDQTVVAHGLFAGSGSDHSRDQTIFDVLHLGGGTLRVRHPDTKEHGSFNFNPKTCHFAFSGSGLYTLHKGTGRFTGVRGHGSYALRDQGTLSRNSDGTCNMTAEPTDETFTVRASGPASLPA